MRKSIIGMIAVSAAWLMLSLNPDECDAQTQAPQGNMSDLAVAQIALKPFLMGQLESLNAPITNPPSRSFTQLDMGLRWLTVEELSLYSVKSVLRKLPLN